MKLISWNVFTINPSITKGLKYIIKLDPDIICLQELPHRYLIKLKKLFPEHHIASTPDSNHCRHNKKNNYIVTISKFPIDDQQIITYFDHQSKSLYNRLIYQKLQGYTEAHDALIIKVTNGKKVYHFVNARLSAAVNPRERLEQIENLLKATKKLKNTFILGDLNIYNSKFLNLISGWSRGFTPHDYVVNERNIANQLISKYRFQNPFQNLNTTSLPLKNPQPDHTLVPTNLLITQAKIHRRHFRSDHRILEVSI